VTTLRSPLGLSHDPDGCCRPVDDNRCPDEHIPSSIGLTFTQFHHQFWGCRFADLEFDLILGKTKLGFVNFIRFPFLLLK
jgi:hypothetical protein